MIEYTNPSVISYKGENGIHKILSKPKVNSNNEIIIHTINKDSWNRKEITEIINKTIDKWSFEKDTGSLIRENWAKKMLKK